MTTCLDFEQLFVPDSRVEKLKAVGDRFSTHEEPGASEAFSKEVGSIETFTRLFYGAAMLYARKTEDPQEILALIKRVSEFCKDALQALVQLKAKYPDCGTPELYDMVLDYKMACDQRYGNLIEEIECQDLTGLFPVAK